MKKFLQTVFHAALGGFAAGLGAYGGVAQLKTMIFAGIGGAITSVISLWTRRPGS